MSIGKDIAIIIENNCWDLRQDNNDLIGDDGLETAIVISLFTDARVTTEQLPEFSKDKKGWWGNMIPPVDQDNIGSRLWTLRRSKITNENLRLHEDYARESLQWLIEDGVASSLSVRAQYNDELHMIIDIDILRPDNQNTKFGVAWDNQGTRIINRGVNNGI